MTTPTSFLRETMDELKKVKLIADRLKQGDSVVIEDGSHGMVYGIRAISARKNRDY